MKRPLSDIRPIGPIFGQERRPEDTGIEIRGGPIWTWVEVTTFTGDRETTREMTPEDIIRIENIVTDVLLAQEARDIIEFVGELSERDIFCTQSSDITVSCFIRHDEDFISIPALSQVTDALQDNINAVKDLTLRDYRVVDEEFIEQQHPEIL